jgi:PKD repeat protein/glucose/arabinose dehydrogenase
MARMRVGLIGAIAVLFACALGTGTAAAQEGEFVKTQLVDTTLNPMEIEVAPDGTVFYTERRGVIGVWDPATESAREIGTVTVTYPSGENGLMGIALDPDYASNGWIYLAYSALPLESQTQRVSRFQLDQDGDLDLASEVPIFEWTHLREPDSCCHAAGALEFDPDGNLLITTGDNVNPFASQGYAPIDERPGREVWDAQRTSANTNDHNGKLLRITPLELIPDGTEPGIGQTYSIPAGNMFPVGTEDTLPEIHSMGFRNPFRFKVDEETGWTLLADYGPDAGQGNPARGPQGSVEFNVIQEPINSGWPYCIRATVPYIDGTFGDPNNTFTSSGDPFDCENPTNDSPNNTGLTELPPVFPATMWQGFSETDPRYPGLGTNGAPMAGPRYYYDPSNPSPTKFPEEFDGKWFIASWNNDWIRTVDLDAEGTPSNVQNFPNLNYLSPMDMEFGPDGSLYLAEWGNANPFGQDHPDSGIYRIDHVGGVAPQVTASADPTSGTVPLEVSFDGEATNPDGTPNPNFTYAWDFGDGGTSNEEDPTHTYTEAGTFTATLTVTDPETEEQGTDTVTIRVEGSSCPTGRSDDFEGTELDPKWEVVRRDDTRLSVSDGSLNLVSAPFDIFGNQTGLPNIVLQPLPGGGSEPWSITAEMTWSPTQNFQNAGLMIYEDDDNYIKTGMVWNGARNFELIKETDGNPTFPGGSTSAAPVGDTFFLRFISADGNSVDAQFSADGSSWTDIGTTGTDLTGLTNPRIGVYATASNQAGAGQPTASFHSVEFEPDAAGGIDPNDEFDGSSLDKTKWNSIVREQEDLYEVSGGQLHVTTVNGDIYEGGDPTPTRNFFLQTPDHAGADWTIETKIDASELSEGYEQAGLMAYEDDSNYVKFDILSDQGQTVLNRIELRSEEGDVIQNPQPQVTDAVGFPGEVWLRLTKTGDMYTGEYSFDGETFTALPEPVQNDMGTPRFGIYTLGQLSGGAIAHFEYFSVEGDPPCPPGECVPRSDEFDGSELETERWSFRHPTTPASGEGAPSVAGGNLVLPLGESEIDTGSTGPIGYLGQPLPPGGDWEVVTEVSAPIAGDDGAPVPWSQVGLMLYQNDAHFLKLAHTRVGNAGGGVQPTFVEVVHETADVRTFAGNSGNATRPQTLWLRLLSEGGMVTGYYSEQDPEAGGTWTEVTDNPIDLDAVLVGGGPVYVGPYGGNGTVDASFDYVRVTPDDICPGENQPPVIDSATASPTIGVAPLEVNFTASASDPDDDELTYEWDFGDGETSNEQSPTHTYTEPGEYEAEVTVSDGEAEVTETVSVQVLEPDDAEASFRTLVFSETAGFRHSSIDEGHAALEQLGEDEGFQVDHTEDSTVFRPDVLSHYDTVTFLSTTGDVLSPAEQGAFEDYIQGGGGYTGIHSASDTEYEWEWYGHLVGAYFRNHPPGTPTATVRIEDQEHPSTAGQPASYTMVDEWYNFQSPVDPVVGGGGDDYSPRGAAGIHVLGNVDESTYDEQDGNATDDDHPLIWCQRYDGGRSWYTAMGHAEATFTEANFLQQVLGGLETTAGIEPSESCGVGGEPDLRLQVTPGRDRVRVGQTAAFTATVRNTGDGTASNLRVCVKAPKSKLKVVGKACVTRNGLAPGARMTPKFKLKPKRSARGKSVRVTFTATAAGLGTGRDTATVKVKR